MISTNVRPSSIVKTLAYLAPASISAATNFSAYVDTSLYHKFLLLVLTGTQAGCDVELLQSAASDGTGNKALNFADGDGAKFTLADADDNKQFEYDLGDLDAENAFRYVNVKLTPASAGVIGAVLFGVGPKFEKGSNPST